MFQKIKDKFDVDIKADFKKAPIPNTITLSRVALGLASAGCFIIGSYEAMAATFFCAAATDAIDGKIARKTNKVTRTGAVGDAICDKGLALVGGVICLILNGPLFLIPIALEGVISLINLEREKNKSGHGKPNKFGKIKEVFIKPTFLLGMLTSILSIDPSIIYSTIGISALVQTITAGTYLHQLIEERKFTHLEKVEAEISLSEEELTLNTYKDRLNDLEAKTFSLAQSLPESSKIQMQIDFLKYKKAVLEEINYHEKIRQFSNEVFGKEEEPRKLRLMHYNSSIEEKNYHL